MSSIATVVEIDDIDEFVTVENVDAVSSVQTIDENSDVVDDVEKFVSNLPLLHHNSSRGAD